jgi:hypothetical protein
MDPVRPHKANIQPGTLFSYAFHPARWGHADRWLVVEVQSNGVQTGAGPTCSITALNQLGNLKRIHLYPSDKILVHSE